MRLIRGILAGVTALVLWHFVFTVGAFIAMGMASFFLAAHDSPDWPFQLLYGLVSAGSTCLVARASLAIAPSRTPFAVWGLIFLMGLSAASAVLRGFFMTPLIAWAIAGAFTGVQLSRKRESPT